MSQVSSKPENFSIINSKQEGDKRLECLGTASNLSVNCQLPGTDFLKAQRLACIPYVSSVFRPLVKQTSVELDRQLSEPQREKKVKDLQKYGTIVEERSGSQANVAEKERESDVESSPSSSLRSLSWLNTRQSVTVCTMAVANLCSMIAFSCIAPFYPAEAKEKGLTDSQIGVIFGVFELVVCIASLILGKYMVYIGSKRMLISGLMITGIAAILFGFLKYLPSGTIFFVCSISVRMVEAIGDACFVTASFVISVKCFPAHISTVIGTLETFAGFGFTAGPMIGAALYDLGGFELPFLVLGATLLLVSFISCYLIENYKDEPSSEKKGMIGMLKVPMVWVILFAVVIYALSTSFLDPTLAEHLSSFKLSTTVVGFMFLLDAGIYTVTAPLWGVIYDKWRCAFSIMVFGAAVSAIALFLIGPAPFLNMEKQLSIIAISLCVLGVASGAFYIPTFQKCLEAVRDHNYEDSFETYAGVSGIFQSAFAFGSFIGPTVGGISVQWFGFAWTSATIGFLCIILVFVFYCHKFITQRVGM
uniref:MFS domain-containing protein n=1 Tax=Syphacia muris TaxID=451379 RepID=A0A0N5ANX0_9BILA